MKKLLKLSLALIFVLGTYGVYAQGGTPDNAASQSVGSFHGFQVTLHPGNDYEWNVYEVGNTAADFNAAGTPATGKYKFYDYDPGAADFATKYTGTGVDTYSGSEKNKVGIQWLDVNDTDKVYAVEVTEYNGVSGACSTKRRYFISVSADGVDFMIAALNASDNSVITGTPTEAQLTRCNSFSGNILANGLDAAAKKTALGTTSVYYRISMKTGTQDWNGAWGFDYNLTNTHGTDLAIAVLDAVDGATAGSADTATGKITVNAGNPVAYLKVTFQNVLGTAADADITFNLSEKNADAATGNTTAFITAGTTQFESFEKKAGNKVVTDFIIKASPDTSAFTVE